MITTIINSTIVSWGKADWEGVVAPFVQMVVSALYCSCSNSL